MAAIQLERVTKHYETGGAPAVDALSLDIADGEFFILVGPSGCGKSTALRMIAGLEDVSDGEIRIGGKRVDDVRPKHRDIAMVFQNYALYPHMTVRDNMGFALRQRGTAKAEITRRVEEAARVLELDEFLDRKPGKLSGGQRQRVAMGRAIVREPQVFLMDEPLSNLDAKLRVEMREVIATLQARLCTTTIYVTHDQTEAMTLGDRVAVMNKGVLQQVDAPRQLYRNPANLFVASFIGSPSINLFPGRVDDGEVQTSLGTIRLDDRTRRAAEAATGRDVVVGIRPEHLAEQAPEEAEHACTMDVRVALVEALGAETLAYFEIPAGGPVAAPRTSTVVLRSRGVARLDGGRDLVIGDHLSLVAPCRALQLFDAATGAALS